MKTKHIVQILVLATFIVLTAFVVPQDSKEPIQNITEAFNKGSASMVAKHFSSTIEMMILDDENILSKSQAEILLKDFFNKHKPTSFKINHQGSRGNTSFAIGTLTTSSGNFRVSVFLKKDSANHLIHQLRVEVNE